MKRFIIIASFLGLVFYGNSQNLTVEGTAPNLYITHTVAPKENFYSIGRLYNQTPKAIASFNSLVMDKGLVIGQHIKIPINTQNLDAGESNATSSIPLTHLVAKSETISKIAADHNVATATLKQWNNLTSDNIAPGTPLVVGHLKMQSTTAVAKVNAANTTAPAVTKQQDVAKAEVEKVVEPAAKKTEAPVATSQSAPTQTKETPPVAKQEATKETAVAVSTPVKEVPVKEAPLKEAQPMQEPTKETTSRAPQTKPDVPESNQTYSYAASNNMGSIEGVFASVFTTDAAQKSLNNKSGEAATFKSTSGWQDKKYYVLMNDVNPGTIVKISSTENKVVYAKVLGSMPDMKENNGLMMRISNAAASYLGIIDPKFPVQISYYQ